MAETANTIPETAADVDAFLATVETERRQEDTRTLIDLFHRVTGEVPKMWSNSIIGFGSYDYRYESGREGTWLRIGFAPRKAKLSLYLMGAYCTPDAQADQNRLLHLLGKHSVGKSCLYISRLDQVDLAILEQLVRNNWDLMNRRYPQ